MKRVLAAMVLAALALLSACGYLVVEEKPTQVGDAIIVVTQAPEE